MLITSNAIIKLYIIYLQQYPNDRIRSNKFTLKIESVALKYVTELTELKIINSKY